MLRLEIKRGVYDCALMSRIGDTVSLFEAIRLLDSWRESQGTRTDGGKEYTSADTLYAALRSGAIRASGCIDRHQRREISPDEWQDYDLVLKSGFFPNAQFLNAPGMTIIEVISKRVYPPTNVTLKHRRSSVRLPSSIPKLETGVIIG